MPAFIDRTGQKFTRLLVLSRGPDWTSPPRVAHVRWLCRCDCGNTVLVAGVHLKTGHTRSCGCLNAAAAILRGEKIRRHGESYGKGLTTEYRIWQNMINRCVNPNVPAFKDYGGRGITVCDQWLHSYEQFLNDVGRRPTKSKSLDRYPNNDGNYEPGNVRWATWKEQTRNTRRNRYIEHGGKRLSIAEWADVTGLSQDTIWWRLKKGLPAERVLAM